MLVSPVARKNNLENDVCSKKRKGKLAVEKDCAVFKGETGKDRATAQETQKTPERKGLTVPPPLISPPGKGRLEKGGPWAEDAVRKGAARKDGHSARETENGIFTKSGEIFLKSGEKPWGDKQMCQTNRGETAGKARNGMPETNSRGGNNTIVGGMKNHNQSIQVLSQGNSPQKTKEGNEFLSLRNLRSEDKVRIGQLIKTLAQERRAKDIAELEKKELERSFGALRNKFEKALTLLATQVGENKKQKQETHGESLVPGETLVPGEIVSKGNSSPGLATGATTRKVGSATVSVTEKEGLF